VSFLVCNIKKFLGFKFFAGGIISSIGLGQGWANSSPTQHFQWPADTFRKIFISEISSNFP